MILLKVHDTNFEDYIKSLSNPARKNWAYVQKHNQDLTYAMVEYDRGVMRWFMEMWERQPIRGVTRQWAFPVDHVENLEEAGVLRIFGAGLKEDLIAFHFVQMHAGGLVEVHPPMWQKSEENKKRYLAKYMWFNFIKHAVENSEMRWVDFGGGRDDSWRQMIRHRDEYPNPKYKFTYIPEKVKKNPDEQPDFMLVIEGWTRRLEER